MNVLITGGAGFIGTHLARRLLREGCSVTILDSFTPQIHGENGELPADLRDEVRLVRADVRDRERFHAALDGQETVVHLAAETGTGKSMYDVLEYEQVNVGGTAVLVDYLVNCRASKVGRLVVASSRAIYGEGKYHCEEHGVVYPPVRSKEQMLAGRFEPLCPHCGRECVMMATDEGAKIQPVSFYGLTKQVQEQMALLYGETLGISAYGLRYQNVFGPGQSLLNPYTGVLAIFSGLARKNLPINVFEDGQESRDFVYIDDVVEATWRCIAAQGESREVYNVGSGTNTSILAIAQRIVTSLGSSSTVTVTGDFRLGDIRHNKADIGKMERELGVTPRWSFDEGLAKFLEWATAREAGNLAYEESLQEMSKVNLFYKG
ncbi:MAG TPA: SDR family NAD(P)-dependent oxidoreductase [Geobacteraceae bacterium]